MTRKTLLLLVLAVLTTFTLGCGLLDSLTKKATEKGAEIVEQGKATLEAAVTEAAPTQVPSSGSRQPTQAPAAPPTQAPEPTAAPPEEAVDLSGLADIDALDSYRMSATITWKQVKKDGTIAEGAMDMLTEFDRASSSRRLKVSGSWPGGDEQSAGEAGDMEMIQIGTSTYIGSDGEWMAAQLDESEVDAQTGWLTEVDDLAGGQGTYVGTETVNGVSAKHYHYKESEIGGMGFGEMDRAESDVWVSEEFNVVVKAENTWEGEDDEGTQWSGTMRVDVTDINEPIVIEPPEGVEAPGMPEDVPLMEGATNVQSVMGINSFQVPATPDAVFAFYDEEMPANGWEAEDSGIPTMRTYTKGDRQAMLMVEEKDGGSEVTIMVGEQ